MSEQPRGPDGKFAPKEPEEPEQPEQDNMDEQLNDIVVRLENVGDDETLNTIKAMQQKINELESKNPGSLRSNEDQLDLRTMKQQIDLLTKERDEAKKSVMLTEMHEIHPSLAEKYKDEPVDRLESLLDMARDLRPRKQPPAYSPPQNSGEQEREDRKSEGIIGDFNAEKGIYET